MAERALVVLLVFVGTLACVRLVQWLVRRRVAAVIGHQVSPELRSRLARNGPTLVYFYGPNCGTCAEQARALDALVKEGAARVVRLDATRERELADSLGVWTIPATAVLDPAGRVRNLNLGYQPKAALAVQLATLSSGR